MKRAICLITALLVISYSTILFAETVVLKPVQTESATQYTDATTGVTLVIPGAWKKFALPDSINKNQAAWGKPGKNNLPYIMLQNGPLPAGVTNAKEFADGLLFRYRQSESTTVIEDVHELTINGINMVKMVTDVPKTEYSFVLRTATYTLVVGDRAVRIMASDDTKNFANNEAEIMGILNSIKIADKI